MKKSKLFQAIKYNIDSKKNSDAAVNKAFQMGIRNMDSQTNLLYILNGGQIENLKRVNKKTRARK